jgi:hypothetical protein
MITEQTISKQLENKYYHVSKEAKEVLGYMIESFEGNTLEPLYDSIHEVLQDWFIYYHDAAEYLMSARIYEYDEAISMGYKPNVTELAAYYLHEEVIGLLNELETDLESENE